MSGELARCPNCGIKTVPDHQDLKYEEKLCDSCYEKEQEEQQEDTKQ